jgi:hypothetical protein
MQHIPVDDDRIARITTQGNRMQSLRVELIEEIKLPVRVRVASRSFLPTTDAELRVLLAMAARNKIETARFLSSGRQRDPDCRHGELAKEVAIAMKISRASTAFRLEITLIVKQESRAVID